MIQTLTNNWWLLLFSGVLDALMSVIYFDHVGHGFHASKDIALLGQVTMAAGVSTITVGVWRSAKGKCWPLVLNGCALVILGLIFSGIVGFKISFRTIALLIIVTAVTISILELATARNARRLGHVMDEWFLRFSGLASAAFAAVFFALGFRWIEPRPGSLSEFMWLGSYFGLSGICMVALALRLHFQSGQGQRLPSQSPKYAN